MTRIQCGWCHDRVRCKTYCGVDIKEQYGNLGMMWQCNQSKKDVQFQEKRKEAPSHLEKLQQMPQHKEMCSDFSSED